METVANASDTSRTVLHQTCCKVLLIEDDSDMRAMLADILRREGYVVIECPDAYHLLDFHMNSGLECRISNQVDLIISDIRMPGIDGLDLLESRRHTNPDLPTILITAFGDEQTHNRATRLGAAAILDKPFRPEELVRLVEEVLVGHADKQLSQNPPEG